VVPAFKLPVYTQLSCEDCEDFTTLVYEPAYTPPGPTLDDWESWDMFAADAKWWSTRDLPGITKFTSYVTWDAILEAIPDAILTEAGILLETGSGTPGAIGNVDELIVNDQTFDFQP